MTGLGLAFFLAGCAASPGTTGNGGSNGNGGSSASGGSNGNGGSNSSGGSNGSGGNSAKGGSNGNGGTGQIGTGGSNSGGTTGSGGNSAKGGSTGSGGSNSSGGTTGSGGSNSSGGTTGTGGAGTGGSGSGTGGSTSGALTVQLGMTEQKIEGFGINDNWAANSTPASLFTTSNGGIGLTILRTGMSDQGAFYNSGEKTGDFATLMNGAGSDAKLIGSVWSPPASCKTANTVNPSDTNALDGGHLMASCYGSWSQTIAQFAAANGFYAMSIGNEPDFNSCGSNDPCNGQYPTTLMTATEMVAWVKAAKANFTKYAPNVLIIAPEASEWLHTWENTSAGPDVSGKESSDPLKCGCFPNTSTQCASACMTGGGYDYGHYLAADATAWGDFDILGVHEYDSQSAMAWPSDVNGGKPNKEVWETEMSGVKWWPQQGPSCDIANGVAVAGWIHSALTVGQASAWLWWWYQASGTDDNEGLLLKSGSSASGCTGTDTKRHYTLGNFSKFIRPGYMRVDITGTVPSGVQMSAYHGSDGTVVVVAINSSNSTVSVPITITGGTTTPTSMTPNVTDASNNLVAQTAVTVSGGTFTASIGGPSVTTFVGK